ncbi:MAG: hypothetical protein ACODAJ_13360, partial [Planctomycetota bacterium]
WVETVEAGWNVLADADPAAIAQAVERLRSWDRETPPFVAGAASASSHDLYGDGHAAEALADILIGTMVDD